MDFTERPLRFILPALLFLIYAGVIFLEGEGESATKSDFIGIFPFALLLNMVAMATGFIVARSLRLRVINQFTITIEVGLQNSALAIFVAATLLKSHSMALVPVVRPDDFITYRITVTNQGFGSAHNVIVTDTLPANTGFISDTLPFPVITGTGVVSWNITTLLPGGRRSFELTLQANANICLNSSVTNTAEAFGDEPDANPVDNTTTESISLGCRDVGVIKSADAPQTTMGRDVVFTLVYTNPGLITATNTLITDVLPISMTFVQSTPPHSGPIGSEYQWNVGDVPPGITGSIVITGHVSNDPTLCDAAVANLDAVAQQRRGEVPHRPVPPADDGRIDQ